MGIMVKPILAAAFGMLVASAAPAVQAETLGEALTLAYKNSGLIEQNRALLRAADEDVAQAVATLRPVLNFYANATAKDPESFLGRRVSANTGLSASMLLYDGGGSKYAVDAAKETVLATRQGLIAVEQSVLLRAVTAYMYVRREKEFVSLRQNNVRLIGEQLRAAEDRFDVGEITRTDVALAQSRLASARANLAAAKGNLARSREEYRVAVGHYPGSLRAAPKPPATARSLEAAQAIAYDAHPSMRQTQHEVAGAELGVERANSFMRPNLKATSNLNYDRDRNRSANLGLELGQPIYQGGQLTSLFRQAVARRDAARAGLHITRQNIAQGVGNSWASLTVSRITLEATEHQIKAAKVAFAGVKEEATLGARTTLDVLDAEQELLDAKTNRVSALTDRHIATYSLLSAMGLLTVDHLKLNVTTYDPTAYYNAVRKAPSQMTRGQRMDRLMEALGRK